MNVDKQAEKPCEDSFKITHIEGSRIQWFPIYDLSSITNEEDIEKL